jgi:hypothetical protein
MVYPALRSWLGASALSGLMIVGCSHAQRQSNATVAQGPMTSAPMVSTAPYQPMTSTPVVTQPVVVAPEEPLARVSLPSPVVIEEPKRVMQPVSYAAPTPLPKETIVPMAGPADRPVSRRSYADITANPCYAHAADYSSLTGELQLIHPSNIWCLRYASVEEEDRYGGSVTLIETGPMTEYTSGQCVRVEGQLVNPDSRERSPAYRVRSIQRLVGN